MDREIVFRGMDDNKRLIQGYFFQIWEDCFILWGTTNGVPNMTKVAPATVGQFTGLTDKNGVKIFEGDIISTDIKRPYLIVEFRNGCFMFNCNDGGEDYYDTVLPVCKEAYTEYEYGEVIGNIHDNPELLKEEESE